MARELITGRSNLVLRKGNVTLLFQFVSAALVLLPVGLARRAGAAEAKLIACQT